MGLHHLDVDRLFPTMWVRDRLDRLWSDEDFAGWYPRDGRPGIPPAPLATVCVLQFPLGLSDRQAAEAVRCRIEVHRARLRTISRQDTGPALMLTAELLGLPDTPPLPHWPEHR
ncbi:transposase [Streptomyces sp. NPDC101194]|uniref:transposase n=1 Tax=Streptomyces sp. NPDC101194 TaxID=3366127 RepID=UPI00381FE529